MSVELNQIVLPARDKRASAEFLAAVFGIESAPPWGPFLPVPVANGVTIDFADSDEPAPHRCAFLVSEAEFDAILNRLNHAGIAWYAARDQVRPGEVTRLYGGRSFCFGDPDGHQLEVRTGRRGAAAVTPAS